MPSEMPASVNDVRAQVCMLVEDAGLGPTEGLQPAGAGRRNDVWIVRTAGPPLVVRLLRDDSRLEMEQRVLGLAHDADIPVAECLWASAAPRPAMIQSALPGSLLSTVEPTRSLCRDVARLLRRIHGIPIDDGFGNLTPELRGSDPSLPSWFADRVRDEAERSGATGDDRSLLDAAISTLEEHRVLLSEQTPGLAHGDLQPSNLLVEDGRITGVLDWEAAKSGPPGLDFGWWDWWSTSFGTPWTTDELIDAYDVDGSLDRDELAIIRRLVQVRVWARELTAAHAHGDQGRAAAARAGLSAL